MEKTAVFHLESPTEEPGWLAERTANIDIVAAIVEKSLADECIGIGGEDSSKSLRVGTQLGSGSSGSVYDAHLYGAASPIHVAVKIILYSNARNNPIAREVKVAKQLSKAVEEHKSDHFLIFYGYSQCDTDYVPTGIRGHDRSVQLQQKINTAVIYLKGTEQYDVRNRNFSKLPKELRYMFSFTRVDYVTTFERKLSEYVGRSVVMEPIPSVIGMNLLVMEKATMSMFEFLKTMADQRILHDVVGQIIFAAHQFYTITRHYHGDLVIRNTVVLRRGHDYKLIIIDFGIVASFGEGYVPLAEENAVKEMVHQYMINVHNVAVDTGNKVLETATKSFYGIGISAGRMPNDQAALYAKWKSLAPSPK